MFVDEIAFTYHTTLDQSVSCSSGEEKEYGGKDVLASHQRPIAQGALNTAGSPPSESYVAEVPTLTPSGTSLKAAAKALFWADYYNDMRKCWEPCLDPLSILFLVEQVSRKDIVLLIL